MEQTLRSTQRAKLQSKPDRNVKPTGALGRDKVPVTTRQGHLVLQLVATGQDH